jgi:mannose-1-phosphate guanylyltransferase
MSENYYAVIMAGGGGTRLWPLSRKTHPKQMLRLGGDHTLFQIAVNRLDELFPSERILVVTGMGQVQELQRQCPQLPEENFVIEPEPRGTASAIRTVTWLHLVSILPIRQPAMVISNVVIPLVNMVVSRHTGSCVSKRNLIETSHRN